MRNDGWKAGLLSLAMVAFAGAARADDGPTLTGDLTGEWGGLRSRLQDRGIDFQLGYVSETASNVQGGAKQGTRYTDQWSFGATLDLDKLLGLHQARFQATITDRNGRDLSSDEHLGTLQQVQEVFGRNQTWRITQFWYDQKYLDGMLDWKIGRQTVGEDFASFTCDFMNLSFCGAQPGNLVGNYWFNYPVSQWATRLKVELQGFGYAQLGAYEVNPSYLTRRYAFTLGDPPGATGALIPFELGWLPKLGSAALDGSYKLGVWYDTSRGSDVFENASRQPLVLAGGQPLGRDGRYGVYVNFLQQVTRPSAAESNQGLSLFLNATLADRRTATIDSQVAVGMVYTGPFPSRPADDIGLAFARTHVNGRVTQAEELQNAVGLGPVAVQHSEYVSELYYSLHATPWLILRPNFQYILQPGGVGQREDTIILGLKLAVKI